MNKKGETIITIVFFVFIFSIIGLLLLRINIDEKNDLDRNISLNHELKSMYILKRRIDEDINKADRIYVEKNNLYIDDIYYSFNENEVAKINKSNKEIISKSNFKIEEKDNLIYITSNNKKMKSLILNKNKRLFSFEKDFKNKGGVIDV